MPRKLYHTERRGERQRGSVCRHARRSFVGCADANADCEWLQPLTVVQDLAPAPSAVGLERPLAETEPIERDVPEAGVCRGD
eukprot:3187534-Prymnesium_polylepis.1